MKSTRVTFVTKTFWELRNEVSYAMPCLPDHPEGQYWIKTKIWVRFNFCSCCTVAIYFAELTVQQPTFSIDPKIEPMSTSFTDNWFLCSCESQKRLHTSYRLDKAHTQTIVDRWDVAIVALFESWEFFRPTMVFKGYVKVLVCIFSILKRAIHKGHR